MHPSARGYTQLARVLVEGLQARGLLPPATTFDGRVMLPERTDPLARGWHNAPDGANPMSPAYDPTRPLPLPPLPGDGPPDGAGGASKGAGP